GGAAVSEGTPMTTRWYSCNGPPFEGQRPALRPFPKGVVPASRLWLPFPRSEWGCPMTEKLKRRDVVKAVAAVGSLPALGGFAGAAEPDKENKLLGEWLYDGKEDQPCAIFQQGRVLLLVNEDGELATGRITEATKLVVRKSDSWEEGLVGELAQEGKAISWAN